MVDRQHIARILRLNGVTVDTPYAEIRSVLQKSCLSETDIALFNETSATVESVPREKTKVPETVSKKNINSVLKTDTALKPEHVRALLGIDMHISSMCTQNMSVYKNQGVSFLQVFAIIVLSLLFGGGALLGFMWHLEIGMFHVASMR